MSSISLLLFDVSIMLNLPIVNVFFKSHPWLHDAKKKDAVLKNVLCNCNRKSMPSLTFIGCFLKLDVCAT